MYSQSISGNGIAEVGIPAGAYILPGVPSPLVSRRGPGFGGDGRNSAPPKPLGSALPPSVRGRGNIGTSSDVAGKNEECQKIATSHILP